MLELMAFADGELEGEARERVAKLAEESEEAARVVRAMRAPALGAWLTEATEERAAAADGIADVVMARLGAGAGATRLSDARARRTSGVMRGQITVVAGIFALAATILLYVRSDRETRSDREGTSSPPIASVAVPSAGAPSIDVRAPGSASALAQQAPGQGGQGVQVDEIDSPAHGVTVFEIPVGGMAAAANGGGPPSVVIMIEDEPAATP
jgi:hypothetical protein